MVRFADWDLLVRCLVNTTENIGEDVVVDSDEIKAFAHVCMLKFKLEKFIADFML